MVRIVFKIRVFEIHVLSNDINLGVLLISCDLQNRDADATALAVSQEAYYASLRAPTSNLRRCGDQLTIINQLFFNLCLIHVLI